MGVKFHLCLLLIVLGITAYAQENPELPKCDWPQLYVFEKCLPFSSTLYCGGSQSLSKSG
ncbi:uncharacterized protein LOC144633328 isoform X3 [Oculina patagonica]